MEVGEVFGLAMRFDLAARLRRAALTTSTARGENFRLIILF